MAASGEVSGSATAKQLPAIAGNYAYIRAANDNAGFVYLGFTSGVTVKDGTTDVTTGIEIGAGEFFGPIYFPKGNLSLDSCWIICDNAGDDIMYAVME